MDLVGAPAVRLEGLRLIDIGGDVGQHLRTRIGDDRSAARAHQRMHRQLGDLAAEVPQRRVHRADRAIADDARDQTHGAVDALALQRVLAHQHRLQRTDQLRSVHRRRIGRRAEEGVALQALVGVDAQQAKIAGGRCERAQMVARRRDVVPGEDGQRYVVDLHDESLLRERRGRAQCPLRGKTAGRYRLRCVPSQRGLLPLFLQPQNAIVPASSALNSTGAEAAALVRAVAERLIAALAAGAPPVRLAGLHLHPIRALLRDDRLCA